LRPRSVVAEFVDSALGPVRARLAAAGMRRVLVAAALLHPIAIGLLIGWRGSRFAAFAVGSISVALGVARYLLLARSRSQRVFTLLEHGAVVWIAGLAFLARSPRLLQSLPSLACFYVSMRIAASLFEDRTFVERWSRRIDLDFPDFKAPYCRAITFAWCVFFSSHSVGLLWTLQRASLTTWMLAAGALVHLSGVALLLAEFVLRQWWFRDYGRGPVSRLFARVFPANATPRGRRSLAWRAGHRFRIS